MRRSVVYVVEREHGGVWKPVWSDGESYFIGYKTRSGAHKTHIRWIDDEDRGRYRVVEYVRRELEE